MGKRSKALSRYEHSKKLREDLQGTDTLQPLNITAASIVSQDSLQCELDSSLEPEYRGSNNQLLEDRMDPSETINPRVSKHNPDDIISSLDSGLGSQDFSDHDTLLPLLTDDCDVSASASDRTLENVQISENSIPVSASRTGNGQPENIMVKIDCLETYSSTPLEVPSDLPDVLKEIEKLCNQSNILNAMVTYDPEDYRKVVLNGDGVSKLCVDLEGLCERYSGYIIKVNEFIGFSYYEQLGHPPNPPRDTLLRNHSKDVGTIGLIVSGKDLKSGETKRYAVTAAHCLLDDVTQKSAGDGDPAGLRAAQGKLKQQMEDGQWSIKPYNHSAVHPVNGFPEYRMFSFSGRGNWHDNFSHDVALLEIDETVTSLCESSHVEATFAIAYKEHLEKMVERKVKVFIGEDDIAGWIIPSPMPSGLNHRNGLIPGLMVHLKTEKPLLPGKSGSAIKVKYNNSSLYDVIGIIHGRSKLLSFNQMEEIYSGVLLYPNLHQIEADYPIKHFQIARFTSSSPDISTDGKIQNLLGVGYYSDTLQHSMISPAEHAQLRNLTNLTVSDGSYDSVRRRGHSKQRN